MTDEEFERIKAAEKERLRAQRRHRRLLGVLRRRGTVESTVRRMQQGARRLLRETESLVDTLREQVARGQARLEARLGAAASDDATLAEDEEALRAERAAELVRQYKAASAAAVRSGETDEDPDAPPSASSGPEKTIGRMPTPRTEPE